MRASEKNTFCNDMILTNGLILIENRLKSPSNSIRFDSILDYLGHSPKKLVFSGNIDCMFYKLVETWRKSTRFNSLFSQVEMSVKEYLKKNFNFEKKPYLRVTLGAPDAQSQKEFLDLFSNRIKGKKFNFFH